MHLACIEHGVWLRTRCPLCYTRPFETPTWLTSTDGPLTCANFEQARLYGGGRYHERCTAPLDQAAAPTAPADAVDAQRHLFDLATTAYQSPGATAACTGWQVPARVVFEAFLELKDSVPDVGDDDALPPGRDALRAAGHILRQPSPAQGLAAARRYRAFSHYGDLAPVGPASTILRKPRNPLLTAIGLSDLRGTISAGGDLMFRMGSDTPSYPAEWRTTDRVLNDAQRLPPLPMSRLPQTIWPGALDLPDPGDRLRLQSPAGRAAAAIALARYGTARPWRVIATNFALPGVTAAQCSRHWATIKAKGRWNDYLRAVDALFCRLHRQPPPIDYERRRLTVADASVVLDLARHGLAATEPGGRVAPDPAPVALQFWSTYTGGDPAFAPTALIGPGRADQPPSDVDALLTAMHTHLHRDDPDADAGPLSWQPP